MPPYEPATRNYADVHVQTLREPVDDIAKELHDDVSAAYYAGEPFSWGGVDFGTLSEDEFQSLHDLSDSLKHLFRHRLNLHRAQRSGVEKVPEIEYRYLQPPTSEGFSQDTHDMVWMAQSDVETAVSTFGVSKSFDLPTPGNSAPLTVSLVDLQTLTL